MQYSTNSQIPLIHEKQEVYVHPFIESINKGSSEQEIIDIMTAYMGTIPIGKDENGNEIFDYVDQTLFIQPVMIVFSYATSNNKTILVDWLLKNYVPLQVSYSDNFCYFEALKWNYNNMADLILQHKSFIPSLSVLENLIHRNRYDLFKICMNSPCLEGVLFKYKYNFLYYLDKNDTENIINLLNQIKEYEMNNKDIIYPIMSAEYYEENMTLFPSKAQEQYPHILRMTNNSIISETADSMNTS